MCELTAMRSDMRVIVVLSWVPVNYATQRPVAYDADVSGRRVQLERSYVRLAHWFARAREGEPMSPLSTADPGLDPPDAEESRREARQRRLIWAGVTLLLLALFGQLAYSVRQESLSWDEGDHIFAGYMALKYKDHGLNPEHPPLVKMVAAVPLLSSSRQYPTGASASTRER